MSVYKKLQQARIKLQGMSLKKSGHNKFASYDYFELGDFLPATQQIFAELGLCGVVSFEGGYAILRVIDTDTQGEPIVFRSPMAGANLKGCHPIQNLGAVQTYERRYLWVMAMEIVEHDALDASEPVKPAKSNPAPTASKPVAVDTFEYLSPEEQQFLREQHAIVMESDNPTAMYQTIKESLDTDEQVAFWSLFDSKQRAAIKAGAK